MLWLATSATGEARFLGGTVAALGFLMLAGTLMSELVEGIGLPHLTGYILAGLLAGPHVLHLVDHADVEELSLVNSLALALIAISGGAQLRVDRLREAGRSIVAAIALQSPMVIVVTGAVFFVASPWIAFTRDLSTGALIAASLLWGVLAASRSPAAVLGVLSQTRSKGPLTTFSVAFVVTSDVLTVAVMAAAIAGARMLVDPSASLSTADLSALGQLLVGSTALGTTLGLVLAIYLRLVGRSLLVVLLGLGFGLTELLRYVRLDPLLAFMVAGFFVQNTSKQGPLLVDAVQKTGAIVFVVFFATAGAHLDLPLLLSIWPVALALAAGRIVATIGAARLGARVAGDGPTLRRWGWSGLVSQAGLTLGLAGAVSRSFPEFGDGFASLAIGVIAINELVGPVLFKLGLDRSRESAEPGAPIESTADAEREAAAS